MDSRMKSTLQLILAGFLTSVSTTVAQQKVSVTALPPLPDLHGFAGMFAGVSGGSLLCAGGANFPTKPLTEGGQKAWHDRVFALAERDGAWREVGHLPQPNAYGISATWRDSVVVVGGGNEKTNFREAYLIHWDGKLLSFTPLPPLPTAIANSCGALVGDTLYVAGGQETPNATNTLKRCFSIDLSLEQASRQWHEIPWPSDAPGRILAVAGAHDGWFYMFSGANLYSDANGRAARQYLTDAWRYRPKNGWQHLSDLPHAVAAAPTPAMLVGNSSLAIAGGVSPEFLGTITANGPHPGFPRELVVYDIATDKWRPCPKETGGAVDILPPRVTAPLIPWQNLFAVPSGEVAPGVRTPTVLAFRIVP